ncbi:MAG: hypothetical protein KDC53_15020 [Saprospiraceae bacterium]|nr:hypothetical protein [Saprospiraceae bacterium]
MKKYSHLILILFTFLLLQTACKDDVDPIADETEDYSDVLHNIANNVILPTYSDLKERAEELADITSNLEINPTPSNLLAAQEAWVNARSPWEQSEGFLFGPVDEEGLDPSLDSWPVNVTDLNNVLNSSNNLTVEFLEAQEGTLKGFHTIEFLLWGEDGTKSIDEFTDREFEYLSAATGALANDAASLADLWLPASGNYIEYLLTAGDNILFPSQKSAIEQIVDALEIIADEVGNGKINDPLSSQDLSLEESRFSANSKADFADNIRSIQNIYLGMYGNAGNNKGINTIIAANNPQLNTKIKNLLEQTIILIENLPGTFSEAIFNNPSLVSEAQDYVRNIERILAVEVTTIVAEL